MNIKIRNPPNELIKRKIRAFFEKALISFNLPFFPTFLNRGKDQMTIHYPRYPYTCRNANAAGIFPMFLEGHTLLSQRFPVHLQVEQPVLLLYHHYSH